MPISDTTLIRILKSTEAIAHSTQKVLGVNDWPIKKGQTYGTILVDMENQQSIDLLPDRESKTLEQWLKSHSGVEIICRDRASCYAEGARKGAPEALQVADRRVADAMAFTKEPWRCTTANAGKAKCCIKSGIASTG